VLDVVRGEVPIHNRSVTLYERALEHFQYDFFVGFHVDLVVSLRTQLHSERIIELSNKRGLVGSSVVPQRLSALHQHLVGIGSENSHRLLDKLGKWHCPGFVVAAKQVGLHPRRR
jgi:hypothetical protein